MKEIYSRVNKIAQKTWVRLQNFKQNTSGAADPVSWVIGVFIGVLLFIGLYLVFKDQIDTFVKDNIFGRMNNMQTPK